MRANCWLLFVLAGIVAGIAVTEAGENKGAEIIVLRGGRSGRVTFPHATHQKVLKDCKLCHHLFPQKQGAIKDLKKQGKLKKKAVMRNCMRCHRKTAKTGRKSGPVRCKTCHRK
ncbi:MAG: cytochrome c3 family protein [Deltaproteobacteria bacterium]|nr:cytochrome c3 family protein [Deltaproteobacteria bacterium]MBW2150831.1 cytochrome c3 family protein [Deltaproteobacteria bacterium]